MARGIQAIGLPDGVFDPATDVAVRAFQRNAGLAVDGVVGRATCDALVTRSVSGVAGGEGGARQVGDMALEFLKRHEGCKLHVYQDVAGYDTIGVGHLIVDDDPDFSNGITERQALELLRTDVGHAEQCVNSYCRVRLEQHQFDALVSFVFNVGGGAFRSSMLLRKLNRGDYESVPAELRRWNRSGGEVVQDLINRREAEGKLWRDANYEA